jgi:hypothetical protein
VIMFDVRWQLHIVNNYRVCVCCTEPEADATHFDMDSDSGPTIFTGKKCVLE